MIYDYCQIGSYLMKAIFAMFESWFCRLELKISSKKMRWLHLEEERVHTVLTCNVKEEKSSSTCSYPYQHQLFSKDELKQSCTLVINAAQ